MEHRHIKVTKRKNKTNQPSLLKRTIRLVRETERGIEVFRIEAGSPHYQAIKESPFYYDFINQAYQGKIPKEQAFRVIYEYGEVYARNYQDVFSGMKSSRRRMGKLKAIEALEGEEKELAETENKRIAYAYYTTAPRHTSYEKRMGLKESLGKYRYLYRWARRVRGVKKGNKTVIPAKEVFGRQLTREEREYLKEKFGGWERFYAMARDYRKIPTTTKRQQRLERYIQEEEGR